MATDILSTPISRQAEEEVGPEILIDELLGQGLGYDEWKKELKARGNFTWSESLKNTIIRREFSFFKEEILHLKSEPNKSKGLQSKTNSLESILKRLQGLEWGNGMPNEMETRRRGGRLLGKDAKARCLQYHVARWKNDDSSGTGSTYAGNKPRKPSNTRDTDTNLLNRNHAPRNAATVTSPQIVSPSTSFAGTGRSKVSENIPPRNSNSKVSSLFGQVAKAPVCDPTLCGYSEIPWVPLSSDHDIDFDEDDDDDSDVEADEISRYVDPNSRLTSSTASQDVSFELPRGDGINDSYGIYVYQASQNPTYQMRLLEDIMNSYNAPLEDGNAMLSDSDWLNALDHAEDMPVSEMSSFMQQCSTVASSFSDDVGISPQDLILNGTKIDMHNETYRKAETPQNGNGTLSTKSQDDCTASITISQNQPDSGSPTVVREKTSRSSHINQQTSRKRIKNGASHLADTKAELRKKRDELAAAEAIVSTLRNEVKVLEASTKAFEEIRLENSPHTHKHKWTEDENGHRAKRVKENSTSRGPSDFNNEDILYPVKRRVSNTKEVSSDAMTDDTSQLMNYTSPGSTVGDDTDTEYSFPKFFDNTSSSNTFYNGGGNTFKFESLQTNLLNEESKRQTVLVGS